MPVVMASVLVISLIFLVVNILTDISYSIIDPRVRLKVNDQFYNNKELNPKTYSINFKVGFLEDEIL